MSSLRRDIWLVVHRDLQQNAPVRAVLQLLAELIPRERSLIAGEALLAPAPELAPRVPPAVAAPREVRSWRS